MRWRPRAEHAAAGVGSYVGARDSEQAGRAGGGPVGVTGVTDARWNGPNSVTHITEQGAYRSQRGSLWSL